MHQFIKSYVRLWENRCYKGGVPDEVPKEIEHLVPSYKLICVCIMKGRYEDLGFIPKRSNYYDELKRIEISARGTTTQLKLW